MFIYRKGSNFEAFAHLYFEYMYYISVCVNYAVELLNFQEKQSILSGKLGKDNRIGVKIDQFMAIF